MLKPGSWKCPKCGRSLTIPNQEHVCGLYVLDAHFEGKDPLGQIAFDWICSVLEGLGPLDVLPMKTMIAFAAGVNVAFLKTKRRGAEISLVLPRGRPVDRLVEVVSYSRQKAIYRLPISSPSELDDEAKGWLIEAYEMAVDSMK